MALEESPLGRALSLCGVEHGLDEIAGDVLEILKEDGLALRGGDSIGHDRGQPLARDFVELALGGLDVRDQLGSLLGAGVDAGLREGGVVAGVDDGVEPVRGQRDGGAEKLGTEGGFAVDGAGDPVEILLGLLSVVAGQGVAIVALEFALRVVGLRVFAGIDVHLGLQQRGARRGGQHVVLQLRQEQAGGELGRAAIELLDAGGRLAGDVSREREERGKDRGSGATRRKVCCHVAYRGHGWIIAPAWALRPHRRGRRANSGAGPRRDRWRAAGGGIHRRA